MGGKEKTDKKSVAVVVEDEKHIEDFLRFLLERQGYRVFSASDGVKGYDLIKTQRPHLVITDLMLPEMDGFTILRNMRQEPGLAGTRVFVMSAYSASDSTRQLIMDQPNVSGILSKPIRKEDLLAKLGKVEEK